MIKVVDRVPTRPGRVKLTPENGGAPYYVVMERADEPSVVGTKIDSVLFKSIEENAITVARIREICE